jgi:hypothetical protein
MRARNLRNGGFFGIAKAILPLALKILPDRAANAPLDLRVRINKGQIQPPGELSPDCGFARAGETY